MKYLRVSENLSKIIDYKIIINNSSSEILLIDEKNNNEVLSTIQFSKMDENTYYVGGVASKKGLGLGISLYKYAMMSIYPNKLMPSRDGDVRGGAWNIWNKLYNDDSVNKDTLDIGDDDYSISIYTGQEGYLTKEEILEFIENENEYRSKFNIEGDVRKDLDIFNSMYSIEPSDEFLNKSFNINKYSEKIREDIMRKSENLFSIRYNESRVKSFSDFITESNGNKNEINFSYDLLSEEDRETLDSYDHYFIPYITEVDFDWLDKREELGENFSEWVKDKKEESVSKNLGDIISKVTQDMILLKKQEMAEKKLEAFEELITPVLGNSVLCKPLSKFAERVLMNPYLSKEELEKSLIDAKEIFDEDGNIDKSKVESSDIFIGGGINLPAFEYFVEDNPEYKGVFDDWKKLFDENIKLSITDTHSFDIISIEKMRSLRKALIKFKK